MERANRSITRSIGKFIGITFVMLISGFAIGITQDKLLQTISLTIWWYAGIYWLVKLSIISFTFGKRNE